MLPRAEALAEATDDEKAASNAYRRMAWSAHAAPRLLVRVLLHLFLSCRDADRTVGEGRRCRRALAAVPARADLQVAGDGDVALQPLSVEGQLHVARHEALVRCPGAAEI